MKKAYRVKSESAFQRVFDEKQSTANRQFVVYIIEKPGQNHFKLGISAGKKLGNAVVRNRVKRYIRQAILELDQEEKIKHEYDFLVIARQPVVDMTVADYKKSLTHVLNLAGLITEKEEKRGS